MLASCPIVLSDQAYQLESKGNHTSIGLIEIHLAQYQLMKVSICRLKEESQFEAIAVREFWVIKYAVEVFTLTNASVRILFNFRYVMAFVTVLGARST